MVSATDQTEQSINSYSQATECLRQLPNDHPKLNHWLRWSHEAFAQQRWRENLQQCMVVAYARMALRNGTLSQSPRSYHNERHINDLLLRVIYCSEHAQGHISKEGMALLSMFSACHDLRQAEAQKPSSDNSLVGANEMASFEEAIRIIKLIGISELWTEHHLLLLKTMIEGSTFGSGGKRSKNFFQGNLAKHLLTQLELTNTDDNELVLLACDLDTANVCLPIDQFAASAIHIFDELISHQNTQLSAHQFFSQQQKIYFFDQQAFHAQITKDLFQSHKTANSDKLLLLSEYIANLPDDLSADQIKQKFKDRANQLSNI